MRHLLRSFLSIAIILAVFGQAEAEESRQFSNKDVRGNYGFVFDGVVLNQNDGTRVPMAAVGQFTANGHGHVSKLVRTLNIGGEIQKAVAQGTYMVNPNGTGMAEFLVQTISSDGSVIAQSIERFSFVLNENGNVIQFIGLDMRGPNDEDMGIGVVLRGEAQRQKGRR